MGTAAGRGEVLETGSIGVLLASCVSEGINYVQQLGPRQDPHPRASADTRKRLQTELPPLGYKPLTPRGTETPILAFELKDAAATAARRCTTEKSPGQSSRNENRMRLSVSVFNTHQDIDRVVDVLRGRAALVRRCWQGAALNNAARMNRDASAAC